MANSYLLDTCVLVSGVLGDDAGISAKVRAILDGDDDIFISVASLWEINIKCMKGGAHGLPGTARDYHSAATSASIVLLPVEMEDVHALTALKRWKHKDPFDRLIVAAASCRDLTLLTPDTAIRKYLKSASW